MLEKSVDKDLRRGGDGCCVVEEGRVAREKEINFDNVCTTTSLQPLNFRHPFR
jgi:hypothetical protein